MQLQINSPSVTIYSHLSYQQFFKDYNSYTDGQVYVTTYSFEHKYFDFWSKLEPLSVLYVDEKYRKSALSFLRRFPLFEVQAIPKLHSKAVFFRKSGKLLIGSENLFSPNSTFAELMLEIVVPEDQRDQIIKMAFRSLKGEVLTCQYNLDDIRLHSEGWPYLPCQEEVTYWDLLSNVINFSGKSPNPEYNDPNYVYHLLEYRVDGRSHILSFDRGYVYCGDISEEAYRWLIENCKIRQYLEGDQVFNSCADELGETSPRKDYFRVFHPIASKHRAIRAYWLEAVKDRHKHRSRIKPPRLHEISKLKIRRPE